MKLGRMFTAMAFAALLLAACATEPLRNVERTELNFPDGVAPTMADVEKAIYRGAADRGWTVRKTGPGELEAELRLRTHVAIVRIDHDARSFSITYKDSQNLEYDGTTINRNYNRWLRNLKFSIIGKATYLN